MIWFVEIPFKITAAGERDREGGVQFSVEARSAQQAQQLVADRLAAALIFQPCTGPTELRLIKGGAHVGRRD